MTVTVGEERKGCCCLWGRLGWGKKLQVGIWEDQIAYREWKIIVALGLQQCVYSAKLVTEPHSREVARARQQRCHKIVSKKLCPQLIQQSIWCQVKQRSAAVLPRCAGSPIDISLGRRAMIERAIAGAAKNRERQDRS
ncbi:hypothetical protein IAQ61_001901 [Plenodomus lingam]|uniref:uncharacterized protein n=1 Tax=Leptosphaeria maculans TaxID=5022 RepID=UPI003327B75B|nr:hypothetical protein IAQ61_001901 [Plenodomus lingam]